jgi:hypothetical protein
LSQSVAISSGVEIIPASNFQREVVLVGFTHRRERAFPLQIIAR